MSKKKKQLVDMSAKERKQAVLFVANVAKSQFNQNRQMVAGLVEKEDKDYITVINLGRLGTSKGIPYRTYRKDRIVGGIVRKNF